MLSAIYCYLKVSGHLSIKMEKDRQRGTETARERDIEEEEKKMGREGEEQQVERNKNVL